MWPKSIYLSVVMTTMTFCIPSLSDTSNKTTSFICIVSIKPHFNSVLRVYSNDIDIIMVFPGAVQHWDVSSWVLGLIIRGFMTWRAISRCVTALMLLGLPYVIALHALTRQVGSTFENYNWVIGVGTHC